MGTDMDQDAILIAVAVHDEMEARLEPVELGRVQVKARTPVDLRVSYRLADTPKSREAALLRAVVELDGSPVAEKEVAMRDLPIINNEEAGDLVFTLPGMRPGLHEASYTLRLEVSDETLPPHRRRSGEAKTVQGTVELEAIE